MSIKVTTPKLSFKKCEHTKNRQFWVHIFRCHIMHIKQPKYALEKSPKYSCDICDYVCSRKFLLTQHCSTRKHQNRVLATQSATQKYAKSDKYVCEDCGREYKQRSGLWRHKKKCSGPSEESSAIVVHDSAKSVVDSEDWRSVITKMMKNLENDAAANREMMTEIIKEQNRIIKDMVPRMGDTTNRVNINVFLNERCSGALNMSEFIDSLQIQVEDLDYAKDNGLVEGISTMFISKLRQLDAFQRPIHCTDIKREVLYIKDNDAWEKDETREKLRGAIGELAAKHRQAICEWECKNPDWAKTEKGRDEYLSLVRSVMGDVNGSPNENRIIKSIAKETSLPDELDNA